METQDIKDAISERFGMILDSTDIDYLIASRQLDPNGVKVVSLRDFDSPHAPASREGDLQADDIEGLEWRNENYLRSFKALVHELVILVALHVMRNMSVAQVKEQKCYRHDQPGKL